MVQVSIYIGLRYGTSFDVLPVLFVAATFAYNKLIFL